MHDDDLFMAIPVTELLLDVTTVSTAAKRTRLQDVIEKRLKPLLRFDEAAIFIVDRPAETNSNHWQPFLSTAMPSAGESPAPTGNEKSNYNEAALKRLFANVAEVKYADIKRIEVDALKSKRLESTSSAAEAYTALKAAGFTTALELRFKHGDTEGVMALWSAEKAMLDAALDLLEKITRQVAVAVDYILSAERIEAERRTLLLQINVSNALASGATWRDKCTAVATQINTIVPHRLLGITLVFSSGLTRVLAFTEKQPDGTFTFLDRDEQSQLGSISAAEMSELRQDMVQAFESDATVYAGREYDALCARFPLAEMSRDRFGINAAMVVPIQVAANCVATLVLSDTAPDAFTRQNLRAVQTLVPQISLALNNFFAYEEVESLNRHLTAINQAVTPVQTREQIAKIIFEKLSEVVAFESSYIIAYDREMRHEYFFLENLLPEIQADEEIKGLIRSRRLRKNLPKQESRESWLATSPIQLLDFDDIDESWEEAYPVLRPAKKAGIKERLLIKLRRENEPIGVLILHSVEKGRFEKVNLDALLMLAEPIAIGISNVLTYEALQASEREKAMQIALANALSSRKSWEEIFYVIADEIEATVPFDYLNMMILNQRHPLRDFARIKLADGKFTHDTNAEGFLKKMKLTKSEFASAVAEADELYRTASVNTGKRHQQLCEQYRLPKLLGECYQIQSSIYISVELPSHETMLLSIGSKSEDGFLDENLDFLERLMPQISLALVNLFAFEKLQKQEEEKELQLRINNMLVARKDRTAFCQALAEEINRITPHDIFSLNILPLPGMASDFISLSFSKMPDGHFSSISEDVEAVAPNFKELLPGIIFPDIGVDSISGIYTGDKFEALCNQFPIYGVGRDTYGFQSLLQIILKMGSEQVGMMTLSAKQPSAFVEGDYATINALCPQVSLAIENLIAFEQIQILQSQLQQENIYLTEELKTAYNFDEIIGTSQPILDVFKKIGQVAPTDSTVLILGETGTGKELIARAIHNLSPRKGRALIKVNCAALPAQLMESELFGHERGAFTGAIERRIGKFELAQNGTIFLDEMGELPLELQSKLLRVLQEKEIERLGGKATIKVDVRIITATNRKLEVEVREKRFREDLYYRLNVFPIELPPLRNRREDIPALAAHFIKKLSAKVGKRVTGISTAAMNELMNYDFPGNIREMEHLIEQAMIVSSKPILDFEKSLHAPRLGTPEPSTAIEEARSGTIKTLQEAEREHILAALKLSLGRIRGSGGASELLDIKPSTLEARMKKLGIKRTHAAD